MRETADIFNFELEEQIARNVGPAGIDIAYHRLGDTHAPAVLLIIGVASQMIHWPGLFCRELVNRGLQVICFDNRDSEHSTHLSNARLPDLQAALAGDLSSAAYTLNDMAADAIGLLDILGIERAHVVGASMGGQIAQVMATEFPGRVLSLTSMMSTTGGRTVGQTWPEVMRELFSRPPATTRDEFVQLFVRAQQVVGSPGYASDESEAPVSAMTRSTASAVASPSPVGRCSTRMT